MKLYEITNQLSALEELLNNSDIEIDESINQMLSDLQIEKSDKIINIGRLIKNLQADSDAYRAEAKRLTDTAKKIENKIDRLMNYLDRNMDQSESYKDVTCEVYRSKVPSVVIKDNDGLPVEYCTQKVSYVADKNKIKQVLLSGSLIEGCELCYSLKIK